MKRPAILLIFALILGASCSSNKDLKHEEVAEDLTISDAVEDTVDVQEDSEFVVGDGSQDEMLESEETMNEVAASEIPIDEYQAQPGDTLMLMAFKMYGDYMRWREIADLNQIDGDAIDAGQMIKYYRPEVAFDWQPEGDPYLIKRNDTLGLISNKVYGQNKYWEYIWNNNRPLIRDPNVIYAGFTIYYQGLDEQEEKKEPARETASEEEDQDYI